MRVGAIQFRAERAADDPQGALLRSRAALVASASALAPRVDLMVLPEMAATGYLFAQAREVREVAEAADGPTAAALSAVARAHGCWIVFGFPERAGERLYNSAGVLSPSGDLRGVYRKRLLYEADVPWATPGDTPYPLHDTGDGRFGVGICMDLNDDAFTGWLRRVQPEAIAFPTNWVDEGDNGAWDYWGWRLEGVQGALIAANRWGSEDRSGRMVDGPTDPAAGRVAFSGRSAVMRRRLVLAALPAQGNGALEAVLSSASRRP